MHEHTRAFLSYVRFNDDHDEKAISRLCDHLAGEVHMQTGVPFVILRDQKDIAWGQNWKDFVSVGIESASLMIVIVTPSYFRSQPCRLEFETFKKREAALGRHDLILPLYYVAVDELSDEKITTANPWMAEIRARQYEDWRTLRPQSADSTEWRLASVRLATKIKDLLKAIQSGATVSQSKISITTLDQPDWKATVDTYRAQTKTQREIVRVLYVKIKRGDILLDELYKIYQEEVPNRIPTVAEFHYRVKDLAHAGLLQIRALEKRATTVLVMPTVLQHLINGEIIES